MGSGKTSLGEALAARLGWTFHDVDARLEEEQGRSIARIFAEDGEPRFRRLERDAIAVLARGAEKAVIAVGGGAYCGSENQRLMDEAGITIWLDQTFEAIWRRRDRLIANRPLMGDGRAEAIREEDLRRLYEERAISYGAAQARIAIEENGLPAALEDLARIVHERCRRTGDMPADAREGPMTTPIITTEEFRDRLEALLGGRAPQGLPRRRLDRAILLKAVVLGLDPSRAYTEKDLNEALRLRIGDLGAAETDHVTMRRLLVDAGHLVRERDGSIYRTAPEPRDGPRFEAGVETVDVVQVLLDARARADRRKKEHEARGPGA